MPLFDKVYLLMVHQELLVFRCWGICHRPRSTCPPIFAKCSKNTATFSREYQMDMHYWLRENLNNFWIRNCPWIDRFIYQLRVLWVLWSSSDWCTQSWDWTIICKPVFWASGLKLVLSYFIMFVNMFRNINWCIKRIPILK